MTAADTAEPTMEEILASIRKIISEEQIAPTRAEPAAPQPAPALRALPDPVAPETPKPERAPIRASTDVLELTDSVDRSAARQPLPPAEKLISDEAEGLATARLSDLSGMLTRNYPGAENTLDGLVREMLRPMLKSWLDQNLPDMVDSIVTREIARISGRAR